MSQPKPGRRPRKRLAPSEKYEVFVQVLPQQATQWEAAEKWGVDRTTIVSICRTAKQGALDALAAAQPGRPGKTAEQAELAEAKAEIERLRATVTEQAVALHLQQGNRLGTDRRPGPAAGGRDRQGRAARAGRARTVRGRLVVGRHDHSGQLFSWLDHAAGCRFRYSV